MLRNKPNDIRKILEHPTVMMVEEEELGKFFRFALEEAKIDNFLRQTGVKNHRSIYNLRNLESYKTALALEQDA